MSSLTDRIIVLLRSEATSEALAEVIEEARDELATLTEACEDAKERMLDPLSTSADVARARKGLDDSTLQAQRLEAALGHLSDKLDASREREAEAARTEVYEEVAAEREALINEFHEKYPGLAEGIGTLLQKIKIVDAKVTATNQDLPRGASYLLPIDKTIRTGLGWSFAEAVKLPTISGTEVPEHLRVAPGQVQFWPMTRGF